MKKNKILAQSCRFENPNFLYSDDNQNKNQSNRIYQTYQPGLNAIKNFSQSQIFPLNNQKEQSPQDLSKSQAITINNDNLSTFTFGQNKNNNLSSSNRFDSNMPLSESQNINKEALSFEDSNILNSSRFDLTNSIAIKQENNLITKSPYIGFNNKFGDNSCYVNVVMHLLYNIVDLNNIFKDLYQIDEIQKQNPKDKLNANNKKINTNLNTSNKDVNINLNTSNKNENNNLITSNANKKLEQSATFIELGLDDLFVQIGEILYNYEIYSNEENTVQQVTILDTRKMRESLEKKSNGLFPLNYVADPVELFIYILDNLNLHYQREIHNNFHMELIDKSVCRKNCPNSINNKFDKDNFLYHIYVQELINFIKDNSIQFNKAKGDLFHLSYSLYTDEKKECNKCKLLMEKFLLCLNVPKYLLINCVWKNASPEIREIIDFLFLLSLSEDLNNLFICQNISNTKNTKYNLLGMILYSFALCHYTVLIFNKKQKVYTLYNDNVVKEFNTLYDVFPEMLIDNINLYDNEKAYFYPVMLIYTTETLYNSNDIRKNTLDEKYYNNLIYKVEENQKLFIQKHTLTEEQKMKNLQELVEKQREFEQSQKSKKSNNQDYMDLYNDYGNLNIDQLVNEKNNNITKVINNSKNVIEQSNNSRKNNLETSQRLNMNNNYFNYEENEDNNRLAQTQILSNRRNFEEFNKRNNNNSNMNKNNNINNQQKINNQNLNNNNNNQRKNANILSSSQQININNQNNPLNNYQYILNENESNLSNSQYNIINNNRPNLANSVNNVRINNNYVNKTNLQNNQYNKGITTTVNHANNSVNNQSNIKTSNNNNNYNNRTNIINNQYNKGTIVNTSNRPYLTQSQYIVNGNNNRQNLSQSLYDIGGNNNRQYLDNTYVNVGNNNNLAQSHYNIGRK